ncbi:MAG: single-stranded DNA-binding protein, partial [Actinobacteria bacterium]
MASLNRVVLIGNLTRDVEVRSTPDGKAVANLGLAVNRPWTNKEGQREA